MTLKKNNSYLTKLKNMVLTELKGEPVKIIIFGSRARGDQHSTSDIDIGIIPIGKINEKKLVLLKEKIENLNIPYNVDFVNLTEAGKTFKKEALKEAVIWKDYP